ncbi:MAG: DotU family type IV/VI secretion system protein [Planctomycetes bacterium]|nr:DotU family type IV/VI secretion system protein [Planctomycetota bacterium]
MKPDFAKAVDPIFLHVLGLLDSIERGKPIDVDSARERIISRFDQAERQLSARLDEWRLAEYALVCWIDEVLINAAWEGHDYWLQHKLEWERFKSAVAFDNFYEQAAIASRQTQKDAFEVFYVCVVLGFRGMYTSPEEAKALADARGWPADLENWARKTTMSIQVGRWRPRIEISHVPISGAPPLDGRRNFASASAVFVGLLVLAGGLLFANLL